MAMPRILNLELLANPLNWLVVYMFVAVFALVVYMIDPLNLKG